jgi:hypothetical protein
MSGLCHKRLFRQCSRCKPPGVRCKGHKGFKHSQRMAAWVVVIKNNLHDLVGFQDERVGIRAIDDGICGVGACRKNAVKCRYLWTDVSDVVEESIICTIIQIVHLQIESDRVINSVEKRLLVVWHELVVVERLESLHLLGRRLWFRVIVYKPASDVGIQTCGYDIEKVL